MKYIVPIFFLCFITVGLITSCNKDVNKIVFETNGVLHDYRGKLDGCGFVVELQNGKSLEVYKSPVGIELLDNKKIRIRYKTVDGYSICMVGPLADILELKYL